MKTLSRIKLSSQKDDFSEIRLVLKISIVLGAAFVLLLALKIPIF
jgi:hypothetical protein